MIMLFEKGVLEDADEIIFDITVVGLRKLGFYDKDLARILCEPIERIKSVQDLDLPLYEDMGKIVELEIERLRKEGHCDLYILECLEVMIRYYVGERIMRARQMLEDGLDLNRVSVMAGLPLMEFGRFRGIYPA